MRLKKLWKVVSHLYKYIIFYVIGKHGIFAFRSIQRILGDAVEKRTYFKNNIGSTIIHNYTFYTTFWSVICICSTGKKNSEYTEIMKMWWLYENRIQSSQNANSTCVNVLNIPKHINQCCDIKKIGNAWKNRVSPYSKKNLKIGFYY